MIKSNLYFRELGSAHFLTFPVSWHSSLYSELRIRLPSPTQREVGPIQIWLYVLGGMMHPGSDWYPE